MKATENTLRLVTEVPPSTNNAYVNRQSTKGYGRRLTPKGRAFKADVMVLANAAGVQRMTLEPPFTLTVTFYFPDERRRDVDGHVKLLQDALLEAVGLNDKHVHELHLYRSLDRDRPRAEIELKGQS